MTVRQLPPPRWTVPGNSGAVANGWKVWTYEPDSSTPKDTYTTFEGDVANTNPVTLDSRGEATIFWDGIYKVVVKDTNGVVVWTEDYYGSGLVPVTNTQLSLVPNYSFEDATDDVSVPDNWTITTYTNGTQTLDSSAGNQIHGSKALKFTSTGSGGGYAESSLFLVQEAVALSITVPIKSSAADVRNVIEIIWYDRSQVLLSTSSLYDDSTTNPTSWTDQILSATPPSNARFAKIRLTGCHSSDSTTGSTWFDNCQVIYKEQIRRALATRSSAQAIATGVATVITWDTEVYDVGGIYSTSVNPSRMTVPTGFTIARLMAAVSMGGGGASGEVQNRFLKNGSVFTGGGGMRYQLTASISSIVQQCIVTGWIPVTAGDYFEVQGFHNTGSDMNFADQTTDYFAIELSRGIF